MAMTFKGKMAAPLRSMRFSKCVDIFPLFEVLCKILFKYTAAECQI